MRNQGVSHKPTAIQLDCYNLTNLHVDRYEARMSQYKIYVHYGISKAQESWLSGKVCGFFQETANSNPNLGFSCLSEVFHRFRKIFLAHVTIFYTSRYRLLFSQSFHANELPHIPLALTTCVFVTLIVIYAVTSSDYTVQCTILIDNVLERIWKE